MALDSTLPIRRLRSSILVVEDNEGSMITMAGPLSMKKAVLTFMIKTGFEWVDLPFKICGQALQWPNEDGIVTSVDITGAQIEGACMHSGGSDLEADEKHLIFTINVPNEQTIELRAETPSDARAWIQTLRVIAGGGIPISPQIANKSVSRRPSVAATLLPTATDNIHVIDTKESDERLKTKVGVEQLDAKRKKVERQMISAMSGSPNNHDLTEPKGSPIPVRRASFIPPSAVPPPPPISSPDTPQERHAVVERRETDLEYVIDKNERFADQAYEEAQQKLAEEEAQQKLAEEAAQQKLAEEEAQQKRAEEEAQQKLAEEEAQQKLAEEAAQQKLAEEEAQQKRAEEAAQQKLAEEEAQQKRAEEEAQQKRAEEEAQQKRAEEEAQQNEDNEIQAFNDEAEAKRLKEIEEKMDSATNLKKPLTKRPSAAVLGFNKVASIRDLEMNPDLDAPYMADVVSPEQSDQFGGATRGRANSLNIFTGWVISQPQEVFRLLDRDEDGYIVAADIIFFFRKISAKWRSAGNLHEELSIFAQLDEEGHGRISCDVFCRRIGHLNASILRRMGKFIVSEALEEQNSLAEKEAEEKRTLLQKQSLEELTKKDESEEEEEEGVRRMTEEMTALVVSEFGYLDGSLTLNECDEEDDTEEEEREPEKEVPAADIDEVDLDDEYSFLKRLTDSVSGTSTDFLNTLSSPEDNPEDNAMPEGISLDGDCDYVAPSAATIAIQPPTTVQEASFARRRSSVTLVVGGRVMSEEETAKLIRELRPLATRRTRVGGGFRNQVLDPKTQRWVNSDRYFKKHPLLQQLLHNIKQPTSLHLRKPYTAYSSPSSYSALAASSASPLVQHKASSKKFDANPIPKLEKEPSRYSFEAPSPNKRESKPKLQRPPSTLDLGPLKKLAPEPFVEAPLNKSPHKTVSSRPSTLNLGPLSKLEREPSKHAEHFPKGKASPRRATNTIPSTSLRPSQSPRRATDTPKTISRAASANNIRHRATSPVPSHMPKSSPSEEDAAKSPADLRRIQSMPGRGAGRGRSSPSGKGESRGGRGGGREKVEGRGRGRGRAAINRSASASKE